MSAIESSAPTSWSSLYNPKYKGKVAELKKEILRLREVYQVPDEFGGRPLRKKKK